MFTRIKACLFFATATLLRADQSPALNIRKQDSNAEVLQPRQLDQLSPGKLEELLSKGLSGDANRVNEIRRVASAQSVCSIPLLEIKVKNTNGFGKDTMKTPRTFDRIVGATPAPACKPE